MIAAPNSAIHLSEPNENCGRATTTADQKLARTETARKVLTPETPLDKVTTQAASVGISNVIIECGPEDNPKDTLKCRKKRRDLAKNLETYVGVISLTRRHPQRPMPSYRHSGRQRSRWATLRSQQPLSSPGNGCPRKKNIFVTFVAEHYLPKEQPNSVRIVHGKNEEQNWIPLFDKDGPLYPELMNELDAIKRTRIAGVMIRRDKPPHDPWPTFPDNLPDFSHVEHTVKDIIRAAGLRPELSFTSFRHGGTTEAADGDATDAEMRALTRHRSAKVLPRYAKRNQKQVGSVARKKRLTREES
jgi:hypothetical protein